jgi:hypothetical protein
MESSLLLEVGTNALKGLSDIDNLFKELKENSNRDKSISKLESKLSEIFGCEFIIDIARSSMWIDNCGIIPTFKKSGKIVKQENLVKLGNIKSLNVILGINLIKIATPRELTALFLHEIGHIVNHIGAFFSIMQKTISLSKGILFIVNLFIGTLYLIPIMVILTRTLFFTLHIGEYNADKFVVEYGYGDEFISLIHKLNIKDSQPKRNIIIKTLITVYNYIMGGTHPKNSDRIKHIVKIMKDEYIEKYNLNKKQKKLLNHYEIEHV